MKSVTINYFAKLKQERGLAEESVETAAPTLGELYEELKTRHQLQMNPASLNFAKNEVFCKPEDAFDSGDRIALMPPIAGG